MIEEVVRLARTVAKDSIVTQATERLIVQIVEVCAEHEKTAVAAEREACAKIADGFRCGSCGMDGKAAAAIRDRIKP
jgi:hypothetical protein